MINRVVRTYNVDQGSVPGTKMRAIEPLTACIHVQSVTDPRGLESAPETQHIRDKMIAEAVHPPPLITGSTAF